MRRPASRPAPSSAGDRGAHEPARADEQDRAPAAHPDGRPAARDRDAARARERAQRPRLRGHAGDGVARHPRARPAEGAHAPRAAPSTSSARASGPRTPSRRRATCCATSRGPRRSSQQLLVVRCEIGTASTVARQIDNLNHTDIVGTLAGDDTFVVILDDDRQGAGDEALRRPSPRGLARRHHSGAHSSLVLESRRAASPRRPRSTSPQGAVHVTSRKRQHAAPPTAPSSSPTRAASTPRPSSRGSRRSTATTSSACLVDVGRVKDMPGIMERAEAAGAIAAVAIDAKEEFAEHHCLPALMANALYEDKYPLRHGHRPAAHRQEAGRDGAQVRRHRRRPRLHRQGQRPGAHRHRRARPRPEPRDHRPGARRRLAEPRGAARLRRRARHPGQPDQEEPVLDRREHVGPQQRVRRARGPVGRAAGGRLPVRQVRRRRARRAADTSS